MPRHGSEDACWQEVTREYTPGKRHPLVNCTHCNEQWTSKGKARVLLHLESCKELPRDLWGQYSPIRFENGGVAPEKRTYSSANSQAMATAKGPSGIGNGDFSTYATGEGSAGVAYTTPSFACATPSFAKLLQHNGSEEVPETREQLEIELLQLQIRRNEIERRELEIKLKLQQMRQ